MTKTNKSLHNLEFPQKSKISLLNTKLLFMQEMLTSTKEVMNNINFLQSDKIKTAQQYIDLVEKRDEILSGLKAIDIELLEAAEDPTYTNDIVKIKEEIAKTAKDIVLLENNLTKSLPDLLHELKNNIIQIKNGMRQSHAYQINTNIAFGGRYDLRQ